VVVAVLLSFYFAAIYGLVSSGRPLMAFQALERSRQLSREILKFFKNIQFHLKWKAHMFRSRVAEPYNKIKQGTRSLERLQTTADILRLRYISL